MKKPVIRMVFTGMMMAALVATNVVRMPLSSRALERGGGMRLTNYAPLYLDPLEEENGGDGNAGDGANDNAGGGAAGAGDNAGGGTTIIDPAQVSGDAGTDRSQTGDSGQGEGSGAEASQDNAGNADSGSTSQGGNAGAGSSGSDAESSDSNAAASGSGSSQDGNAAAGGGTSGTTDNSSGSASSYVTIPVPVNPNPYTANVNTKDMPATGVEDLRRGVVSVILILFGIIAILISIPTLKGKRRSDR